MNELKELKFDCITLETKEQIATYRFLVLRTALKLEIAGMKRHGRSVYSIVKSEYGLSGSRENVLRQMQTAVDNWKEANK